MSTNRFDLSAPGSAPLDRSVTKLLYVSTAKYGGDWHSLLHTHACTEIFYVVGGRGQFKIQSDIRSVSVGDMVIVNPNVEHTEISLNANPLEYIVMGVDGLELTSGPGDDDRYCIVSFYNKQGQILHLLRGILSEIEAKEPGYELVCQDLLEVLLIRLLRQPNFTLAPSPVPSIPAAGSSKECAQVRRYIDNHFKESINLDTLAELAHINKYYLVHTFTKAFGVSPINYLILRRIEESKYLLADTDHSLSQISHMLGFSSPSYFSQSFRRSTGISPMEYRKQSRKAIER